MGCVIVEGLPELNYPAFFKHVPDNYVIKTFELDFTQDVQKALEDSLKEIKTLRTTPDTVTIYNRFPFPTCWAFEQQFLNLERDSLSQTWNFFYGKIEVALKELGASIVYVQHDRWSNYLVQTLNRSSYWRRPTDLATIRSRYERFLKHTEMPYQVVSNMFNREVVHDILDRALTSRSERPRAQAKRKQVNKQSKQER